MKFQVIWTPQCEKELASLWLESAHRAELTEAATRIDAQLRGDPLSAGESRQENFRILFDGPLAVRFEVREPDQTVIVFDVVECRAK